MTSSTPELPAGSVEIRPAAEGDLSGTESLADLWPGALRLFTEYVAGSEAATASYLRHGFAFDHFESDRRPDGDATYTWCFWSATEPIDLS